eukprot:2241290-Pyramimonas_sp.AAC.1
MARGAQGSAQQPRQIIGACRPYEVDGKASKVDGKGLARGAQGSAQQPRQILGACRPYEVDGKASKVDGKGLARGAQGSAQQPRQILGACGPYEVDGKDSKVDGKGPSVDSTGSTVDCKRPTWPVGKGNGDNTGSADSQGMVLGCAAKAFQRVAGACRPQEKELAAPVIAPTAFPGACAEDVVRPRPRALPCSDWDRRPPGGA